MCVSVSVCECVCGGDGAIIKAEMSLMKINSRVPWCLIDVV